MQILWVHWPVVWSFPQWPLWSWCGVFGNGCRASLRLWFCPLQEVQPGRFWLAEGNIWEKKRESTLLSGIKVAFYAPCTPLRCLFGWGYVIDILNQSICYTRGTEIHSMYLNLSCYLLITKQWDLSCSTCFPLYQWLPLGLLIKLCL